MMQMHADTQDRGTLRLVVGASHPVRVSAVSTAGDGDDAESIVRYARFALMIIIVCLACVCLFALAASAQTVSDTETARIQDAVIEAVQARMGDDVEVTLKDARIRIIGDLPERFDAVPDVGAQTGGPVRFLLVDAPSTLEKGDGETAASTASAANVGNVANVATAMSAARARRLGSIDVKVFVSGERIVARGVIARGAEIAAEDIDASFGDIGRQPIKPLAETDRVVGSHAVRTIAAGEVITPGLVATGPLVQSGDQVRTRVRIGELEARGTAVAAQNGALGEEIVLIAESKRRLKGRVVGEREVEVLHEK